MQSNLLSGLPKFVRLPMLSGISPLNEFIEILKFAGINTYIRNDRNNESKGGME